MKLLIRVLLLVSFASFAGPNALADLADGLVAHYTFDGNVNDATGNGHNGTVYGGAGYSEGVVGSAIDMDGLDDYVRVSDAEDLRMQDSFSASIWFRAESVDVKWKLLHKLGLSSAINYSFASDPIDSVWYLSGHFEATSDADYYLKLEDEGVVKSNVWHHAAFTKNGDTFTMYLDGDVLDTRNHSFTEAVGAYDMLIGAGDYSGPATFNYFPGQLDELRIYDRALSSGEVGQLAVPEPATAISLMVGSFVVLCYRRVRKAYGVIG